LVFQGLEEKEALAAFDALREFGAELQVLSLPPRDLWNPQYHETHHPGLIKRDARPDQPEGLFWWASNSEELSMYWYTYQSRWIPRRLFAEASRKDFAETLFQA